MKIRKIAYILMIALLLLSACGKAETKENAEKTGVEKEDKSQTEETLKEEAEVSSEDIEDTKEEEQTAPAQTSDDDNNKNNETKSNSMATENSSNTQAPKTEPSTKPSTGNTTTQKPSSDSQVKAEADAATSKYMSYYQEVLRLVNEIRAEVGVAPLTLNTTMCQAASMRAIEMDYKSELSHTRPDGSSCFSVLDLYGVPYSAAGENIAMGHSSPSAVVEGWRNSEGHYKNMISSDYTQLGVGYSNMKLYGNTPYWVQLFAK